MAPYRTKMTYLAGPIRSIGLQNAIEWRAFLSKWLNKMGYTVFDPASAFWRPDHISRDTAFHVEAMNREAIEASDFIVARLSHESWNLGTIREIEFARSRSKPVYILSDDETLGDRISSFDLILFTDIADLIQHLGDTYGSRDTVGGSDQNQTTEERSMGDQDSWFGSTDGFAGPNWSDAVAVRAALEAEKHLRATRDLHSCGSEEAGRGSEADSDPCPEPDQQSRWRSDLV